MTLSRRFASFRHSLPAEEDFRGHVFERHDSKTELRPGKRQLHALAEGAEEASRQAGDAAEGGATCNAGNGLEERLGLEKFVRVTFIYGTRSHIFNSFLFYITVYILNLFL